MRTTLNTLFSQMNTNLQRINKDISSLTNQISSGQQMSKISDNPLNMVSSLLMRTKVAELAQFQSNIQYGDTMVTAAENALRQIKEQVADAKVIALEAQSPVVENDRDLIAPKVANLLDQAVTLANTQIAGKYIFGGLRTSGYTDIEPKPFISELVDGYRLNGTAPTAAAPLGLNDLTINGIGVPAALNDGLSNIDPALSAAAKATAINSVADQTGVTATITPVTLTATAPVTAGPLVSGDLIINGIDIFPAGATAIAGDADNVIIDAINAQQASTGVYATHDATGALVLKVDDGRNLQIQTSDNGSIITQLNGPPTGAPTDQTYYGRVQLLSDRTFMLESTIDVSGVETGFVALGLDGGSAVSGEPTDIAGDGKLSVLTIANYEGNVRYAGDREGVLEIKVGSVEKLAISENGQVALKDAGVFTALQNLEDTLLGKNFTESTSVQALTNTTDTFDLGLTGLPTDTFFNIVNGSFTMSITDHSHLPPEVFAARIAVDINVDSPDSIAAKIDGIPGVTAAWDSDGHLQINTTDPERYTMAVSGDSSNFTGAVGITNTDMQVQALDSSMAELDLVFEALTTHITDFGARGNRLDVQSQIFTNLDLVTKAHLSEKQDTDLIKAITDLQAAETAYEAALASSARVMQMSLLDYL